jgi:hypothetical protein
MKLYKKILKIRIVYHISYTITLTTYKANLLQTAVTMCKEVQKSENISGSKCDVCGQESVELLIVRGANPANLCFKCAQKSKFCATCRTLVADYEKDISETYQCVYHKHLNSQRYDYLPRTLEHTTMVQEYMLNDMKMPDELREVVKTAFEKEGVLARGIYDVTVCAKDVIHEFRLSGYLNTVNDMILNDLKIEMIIHMIRSLDSDIESFSKAIDVVKRMVSTEHPIHVNLAIGRVVELMTRNALRKN